MKLVHRMRAVLLFLPLLGGAQELKWAVMLQDGSRLIGQPQGSLQLAAEQTVEWAACWQVDGKVVELMNGDQLAEQPKGELTLAMKFAEQRIAWATVRKMWRWEAALPNPIVHYSLDDDDGVRIIDQGGNGFHAQPRGLKYAESATGKAIRTTNSRTYAMCDDRRLNCGG